MKLPENGWVQLVLVDKRTLIGRVFGVDNEYELVTLMEPIIPTDYEQRPIPLRPPVQYSIKIVPFSGIRDVQVLSDSEVSKLGKSQMSIMLDLPEVKPIKFDRLARREQKSIQKRQAQFGSRAPPSASKEALAIFSALSKT